MTQTIILCALTGWFFLGISGSAVMILFHRWIFGDFGGIPWGQCLVAVLHGPRALWVAFKVMTNAETEANQLRQARRWFDFFKKHLMEVKTNKHVRLMIVEAGFKPMTKEELEAYDASKKQKVGTKHEAN